MKVCRLYNTVMGFVGFRRCDRTKLRWEEWLHPLTSSLCPWFSFARQNYLLCYPRVAVLQKTVGPTSVLPHSARQIEPPHSIGMPKCKSNHSSWFCPKCCLARALLIWPSFVPVANYFNVTSTSSLIFNFTFIFVKGLGSQVLGCPAFGCLNVTARQQPIEPTNANAHTKTWDTFGRHVWDTLGT